MFLKLSMAYAAGVLVWLEIIEGLFGALVGQGVRDGMGTETKWSMIFR